MTYKTKEKITGALNSAWTGSAVKPDLIEKLATGVLGVFPKFDQIAFYVPDMDAAKKAYRALGCTDWTDDIVTAQGKIGIVKDSRKQVNVAHLAFNYQLGIELELIQYKAGNNWHQVGGRVDEVNHCSHPFASHMSWHTEDIKVERSAFESKGLQVVQDVLTLSHTNPHLVANGRKYRYIIFDSRNLIGFDLKLIQRVEGR